MDDDLSGRTLLHRLEHERTVARFVWSPDGTHLAAPTDGGVWIWDLRDGTGTVMDDPVFSTSSAAFSADGGRIAVGGGGEVAVLSRGKDAGVVWHRHDLEGRIYAIAWSRRTDRIAIGGRHGHVAILDAATGATSSWSKPHRDRVGGLAWSHDGRFLASASDDGSLVIIDAAGGRVHQLELESDVLWVTWSPDDRWLAMASTGSIRVWDVEHRTWRMSLDGHYGVTGADYSSDGRLLASIDLDSVCVWDVAGPRHVATIQTRLRGHHPWRHVAFHPSRPVLAMLDDRDKTIAIWELDVERLLRPTPTRTSLRRRLLGAAAAVVTRVMQPPPAAPPPEESPGTTDYEAALAHVKRVIRERASGRVSCFVSYAWGDRDHERWVARLVNELSRADVDVVFDQRDNAAIGGNVARFISDGITDSHFVVVVGTPSYLDKYVNRTSAAGTIVAAEMKLIHLRLTAAAPMNQTVLPLLRTGEQTEAFPPLVRGDVYADFRADDAYFASLLDLVLTLHAIAVTDPAVADLREKLRR